MFLKGVNNSSYFLDSDSFQQQYHTIDAILCQRDQINCDNQHIIELLKQTKSFIVGTPEDHTLTGTMINKKLNRLVEAFEKIPNTLQLSDSEKHYYNLCKTTIIERIRLFGIKQNVIATVYEANDSQLKALLGTSVQSTPSKNP